MADYSKYLPGFAEPSRYLVVERRRQFLRDRLLHGIGLRFLVRLQVRGLENVPETGPTIILMNHIAYIDPVMTGAALRKRFVTPIAKQEVMSYPVLSWLIKAWGVIPIDRSGADRHALMQAIAMLQNGHCVLVAPEGTRHPSMQTVREGVAYLATKTNAVIVPTAVEGTDKFGGNLRRLRRTEVWVTYGPAFRFDFGSDSRPGREDMYQMSTEAAYQIARLLPESRRGVYADMGKLTTDTLRFIET